MTPHLIGLTGGIASGKSEAAAYLKELGAFIIDSDVLAQEVVEEPGVRQQLQNLWPAVFHGNILDRKALRRIVFSSKEEREKLNRMLHPLIRQRMMDIVGKCGQNVCVLVVPLLIEVGFDRQMDEVWVVNAPEETQIERLMKRDGIAREEALAMLESQMPLQEKLARADFIIHNSGSLDEMKRQIKTKWESLS